MKLYYKGMLAVHLEERQGLAARDPRPAARPPGFALLRLLAGGICNTDLELQRGYYGFSGTPGHEFVARGGGGGPRGADRQARGRARSTWPAAIATGAASGLGRHCPERTVLGIVKHPGRIPGVLHLARGAICTWSPTTSRPSAPFSPSRSPRPARSSTRWRSRRGEPSRCSGDGKLGLLIAMVLDAHGYRVHQYGRHPREAGGFRRRKSSTGCAARSRSTTGRWMRRGVPRGSGRRSR